METGLVSVVCVAILLIGTVTTMFTSFRAATEVSDALKLMEETASEIRRTDVSSNVSGITAGIITMWVVDEGETSLREFDTWDIIAAYESTNSEYLMRLTKTTNNPPAAGEWTADGIYMANDLPEVYNPGELDPDEKLRVLINLNPSLGAGKTARFTTSTEYGVTTECLYTR